MADDTIFALSSGAPPAAVAVVRISGPDAGKALCALAGRLPEPRRASVAALRDEAGDLLDRALILWFPGRQTATGEPVAELQLHGGRAPIGAVLAALGRMTGLRCAEPGEFTRRALTNGRIDLTQAEGLADLLASETEGQRRAALRIAEGGLARCIEDWRNRLLSLVALSEAAIEFGEELEDVGQAGPGLGPDAARLARELSQALAAPPAERLHDGVRVVIAGPVNAGKSTLLNALCGREVAIAAAVPGTTRDLIEAPLKISGVPLVITDTAGLRETHDEIERQGVARARAALAGADLILWLGDMADDPFPGRSIVVQSRCDLPGREKAPAGAVVVSAMMGEGLADLRDLIVTRCRTLLPSTDALALNQRHRELLRILLDEIVAAAGVSDEVLIAEHLRTAMGAIDRLTGRTGVEAMLDVVFSRFCVGK